MSATHQAASNVGILAMEAYFPRKYVAQEELETHDGVSAGKYTIGLGQQTLAFVDDNEDVVSMALTVVSQLLRKTGVGYGQIGRLEVATETIMDHSKSIKSVLMQLFEESGNSDVEGIDSMNACYAGTNALFNSLAYVESSEFDGRLALVVAADVAEYAPGPARPSGGCGAVAFLVGPDAPIVLDRACRASHMEHVYDFYKPNLDSPYPVVDGHYSQTCYLRALDRCYQRFVQKWQGPARRRFLAEEATPFSLRDSADFVVFHAPYNKLVRKSFARLCYNDFKRFPEQFDDETLAPFRDVAEEDSYTNRALEKAFVKHSSDAYDAKVAPGTLLPTHIGNTYTASLYMGLLSLITTQGGAKLRGRRVLMFSYGSGLAASIFSAHVPDTDEAERQLTAIAEQTAVSERLADRVKASPEVFNTTMDVRAEAHKNGGTGSVFVPTTTADHLFPGTFYLTKKDDAGRREYAVKE